ncbi:MAG: glycosyltransferase family 39 protein [Janthinobacterium lividum]
MIDLTATSPARRWLVPAFFALVLGLGLLLFADYGLSIDERISRDNGMITLKHLAQPLAPAWVASHPDFAEYTTPLAEYLDRDYGVVFETPVSWLEQVFSISDTRDKFLFRHLCTFLVCLGGLAAVYQLAARRFRDWRVGLLAALWLLLSPRLFAESFYNDKDAVFMSLFAIAMNTGVRFLLRPTWGRAAWHALACALAIDVRIMGILLPLYTLALLAWRGLRAEVPWRRVVASVLVYSVLLVALVVLCWPYLWPAPVQNFMAAFDNMRTFRWTGTVFYNGTDVLATQLPWHYALVWLGITTPVLYLAAALLGLGLVGRQLLRQHWRLWATEQDLQDVFFLGFFVGPLLAVMLLHSVLYDGWRQLYFIYPAFLLLAMRGWVAAARWRPRWASWPRLLYAGTALSLALVAAQMVRDHPLQNVYFNMLAGPNVERRFEMDYWGLGYRRDLEFVAAHDARPVVNVFAPGPSGAQLNLLILPREQRDRLHFVDTPDQADYFLTNFRIPNYRTYRDRYPYPFEIYQQRADGRQVHAVYRLAK